MRLLISLIFLSPILLGAQNFSKDSLKLLEDEELLSLYTEVEYDSLKAERVVNVYLDRAKLEGDTIKMARAYERLAVTFVFDKGIRYVDSLISLTKAIENVTYPAQGYLLKGNILMFQDDLVNSTINYLTAYEFAKKSENLPQQFFCLNNLILSKAVWGNKHDALQMALDNYRTTQSEVFYNKLKSTTRVDAKEKVSKYLHSYVNAAIGTLAFCYFQIKKTDSAKYYINEGLIRLDSTDSGDKRTQRWFEELNMEVDFFSENYIRVLKSSDDLRVSYENALSDASRRNIFLFKGLAEMKLGYSEFALKNLLASDSIFDNHDTTISQPYQRVLFEELREYYASKNNIEKELEYIDKIMFADSVIIRNLKYFEPTLINDYQTPLLLDRKEAIISDLEEKQHRSKFMLYFFISVSVLLLILTLFYFHRQHKFKKRFELLNKGMNVSTPEVTTDIEGATDITDSVINSILTHLERFEKDMSYLDKENNLNNLAKGFNSNPRYLSRVVNLRKGKNFSQYINDLRTTYAFERLKTDSKFRNYTIKAIAEECGFNRAESFSKAFYKQYGIYPSYYIKQLLK